MKTLPTRPDIILFNGPVARLIEHAPTAQAVAVGQGHILAVGSSAEILAMAGPGTERIDLEGRLVVPGFVDTHIHFYEWASRRQDLKLDDLTSLDELLVRIRQAVQGRQPGEWILGQGWNESDWAEPHMPTRKALDRVAPNHPVLLWRCDLHLAVANSPALTLAGIDEDTADPPEGRIERDAAGRPTGVLRELAINIVRQAVAPPGPNAIVEAFEEAMGALHRRGVTGIHDIRLMSDNDGARAFQAFQDLEREKRLNLRCWITLPGHQLDHIIALGFRTGFGNDRLRIGHVKFFSDGGMGARTAWMIEPFLDAACGMPLIDMSDLEREIERAEDAGLSVMVHAVGDRANRELVSIFETLESRRDQSRSPSPAIPHRIEHVQMIRPEDVKRLKKLKLALCVTPANMILDTNLIDSAVGEKGRWAYAFRQLIDTGAPVMFSSDCPVCDPAPLLGIHAAVTRQREDGTPEGGWYPESRVTVAEALSAYTVTPSAAHQTLDCGIIAPGKKADLAILSKNILAVKPSELPATRIDMTLFDGRIVYRQF